MNGMDFIATVRLEFPNIVYIILTGFDITDEIMTALNEHVIQHYFRKPYDIKQIEAAIHEVFPA